MKTDLNKSWNNFLYTMSFMSRIPVKVNYPAQMQLVFFPLSGLITALIVFASSFAFAAVFEAELASLLLLLFYIYLTGALHLDGLGDFFDAYFANRGREKTIEIMHDSNSGVYAVVSLIMILLLKYLLFKELFLQSRLEFLLIMAVMARFFAAAALAFFEAAEASVWAMSVKEKLEKNEIFSAFLLTLTIIVLFLLCFGLEVLPVLLAAAALSALLLFSLARWSEEKIGGISGDLCGTIIELSEIIFLLSAALF